MYKYEGEAEDQAKAEAKEPEKLWPNATHVTGADAIIATSYLTPADIELAQLAIRSRSSVLMDFTLNDAARTKARIDRELARMEEAQRMLIAVKDSIREVLQ